MPKHKTILFIFLFLTATSLIGIPKLSLATSSFKAGMEDTAKNMGYTDTASFGTKTPEQIVAIVIKVFLGVIGLILLGLLIYGGFTWMNAKGNETEVKKAQDIIRNAIIGIILILAAYAIADLVFLKLYTLN